MGVQDGFLAVVTVLSVIHIYSCVLYVLILQCLNMFTDIQYGNGVSQSTPCTADHALSCLTFATAVFSHLNNHKFDKLDCH
jgi:hypothetical protein